TGKKSHGMSPLSTTAVTGSPAPQKLGNGSVINSRKRSSDQRAPTIPASPIHKWPTPKSDTTAEALPTLEEGMGIVHEGISLAIQNQPAQGEAGDNQSNGHSHDSKPVGDGSQGWKSIANKDSGAVTPSKYSMHGKFSRNNRDAIICDEHNDIGPVELTIENLQALQGRIHARN